jgi:diguanylate cyclase (GGDEF)-like protein/PAS domain S-box-containing protein
MGLNFTLQESSALYGLLAENTTDIILKTDRRGFVLHASQAIERLGFLLPNMLIGPHILDLIHPSFAAMIGLEHEAAIGGRRDGQWIEFPALTQDDRERWFEIQIRPLADDQGRIYGALSVMRSIEERRNLEEQLFAAAMTDPLTGLTNRRAFISMLRHLVDNRIGGCLALFDIDHFTAINMRHGQSVGDEVLVVFSDFLRAMMRSEDIISRIGGESIGVLLPRARPDIAEELCHRIISTLAEIRQASAANAVTITASAGIAGITGSLDNALRRAELALFLAKAKGRNRLEIDDETSTPNFRSYG